jgi:hypothetical protein
MNIPCSELLSLKWHRRRTPSMQISQATPDMARNAILRSWPRKMRFWAAQARVSTNTDMDLAANTVLLKGYHRFLYLAAAVPWRAPMLLLSQQRAGFQSGVDDQAPAPSQRA